MKQTKIIKVNDYLTIENVVLGEVVYFEGLNCEEGHISFTGFIKNQKVKGYWNIKTEGVYRLEELK